MEENVMNWENSEALSNTVLNGSLIFIGNKLMLVISYYMEVMQTALALTSSGLTLQLRD